MASLGLAFWAFLNNQRFSRNMACRFVNKIGVRLSFIFNTSTVQQPPTHNHPAVAAAAAAAASASRRWVVLALIPESFFFCGRYYCCCCLWLGADAPVDAPVAPWMPAAGE